MKAVGYFLVLGLFLAAGVAVTGKTSIGEGKTMEFEKASIIFEQNATDGDVEVVFTAQAGDEGLNQLKVVGPGGTTTFEVSVPMPNALGMRQFLLESPEPTDHAAVKGAFPSGTYTMTGKSVSGMSFKSEVTLSHELPAVIEFESPEEDAEDVPVDGLVVEWSAQSGAEAILLEIEQEETGVALNVRLPGDARRFSVPDGFLLPDTEYKLAIGTLAPGGNASFVETSFATAE
jgi:hypothetical protein